MGGAVLISFTVITPLLILLGYFFFPLKYICQTIPLFALDLILKNKVSSLNYKCLL